MEELEFGKALTVFHNVGQLMELLKNYPNRTPVTICGAPGLFYKNPSQEYSKRSEHNRSTCLYDLEKDPAQEHPLEDPALEAEYAAKLKAAMIIHDSPEEQFERLGL